MSECTCNKATTRIGDVHNRQGVLLFRFNMDCPIHGIVVHTKGDTNVEESKGRKDDQGTAG
jgi:hypothetical protein